MKQVKPKAVNNIYKLDATGEIFGRFASKVAAMLYGKNSCHFRPYKTSSNKVIVANILKLKISGKKLKQKKYHRFTGYPSGIKTFSLEYCWQKDPILVFKKTVYDMLPKNKIRKKIIKNLTVKL